MKYLLPIILGLLAISGPFASAGNSGMTQAEKDNLIRQIQAIRNNEVIQPAMAAQGIPIKSGTRYTLQLAGIRAELEPGLSKSLLARTRAFAESEQARLRHHLRLNCDVMCKNRR